MSELTNRFYVIVGGMDQKIMSKGIVKDDLGSGFYLVQELDYIGDEPGIMHVVSLSSMTKQNDFVEQPSFWVFFEDKDHVNFWLQYGGGKRHAT